MTIGKNIKKIRQELNMTQKNLSEGICTQSQISKIEKDEIVPLATLLVKIAEKLNVTLDTLVFGKNSKNDTDNSFFEKNEINKLLKQREYSKIKSILNKINHDKLTINDQIYIKYIYLLVNNYISPINSFYQLKAFFEENEDKINENLKAQILNSLGIMAMEVNELTLSEFYFISGYKIAITINDDLNLFFKIIYNYLRYLLQNNKYKDLYEVSSMSIEAVFISNNIICFPELVYFKYYSINKLNLFSLIDIQELDLALYIASKNGNHDLINKLNQIKMRLS